MIRMLPVDGLCLKVDVNKRVRAYPNIVALYASHLKQGITLPPILVFEDTSLSTSTVPVYLVSDGFLRLAAAKQIGRTEILCDVHPGSERDAILGGVRQGPGSITLTMTEKKMNVITLLGDPEWLRRDNTWIADQCQVSERMVRRIRILVEAPKPPDAQHPSREYMRPAFYQDVKKLAEDGVSPTEIAATLKITRNQVHHAKRAMLPQQVKAKGKKVAQVPSPLQSILDQVEQAADTLALANENFQPKWGRATEEQVAEFVSATKALGRNMRVFVERLKKEAEDKATKGTELS